MHILSGYVSALDNLDCCEFHLLGFTIGSVLVCYDRSRDEIEPGHEAGIQVKLPAVIGTSYRNLPLSGKINLIILTSVLLSQGLLIGLFINITRDITIRNSKDAGLRNLELIGDNLESVYRYADAFSRIIATNRDLQEMSAAPPSESRAVLFSEEYLVRIILDGVIQQNDIVSSAIVQFRDGRIYGSGHVDIAGLRESPDEIRSLPSTFLSELHAPLVLPTRTVDYEIGSDGVASLALARQFISVVRGRIYGVIILNIHEESISRLMMDSRSPSGRPTYMIDRSGSILASSVARSDWPSPGSGLFPATLFDSDRSGFIMKEGGVKYLVTQIPLDYGGWRLVRLAPLSELLLTGRRVILLIVGIGVVSLFLSGLLSVLLARNITRPVRALTDAMDLAGQGDLETRVEEAGGDEIGKMTQNFNRMVRQISALMSEVYQEQSDRRRFELMALQNQIRPHFLYNALDGVCALVQMERSAEAFRMAKALSLFYRGALSGGRNTITLAEELDIVEQYLTIQSMRYTGDFTFSIDVAEKFLKRRALKLSLQPLVENALYHGIRGMDRPGHISIQAEDRDTGYSLVVRDNGRGIPEGNVDGFGIRSVRERIKLYFGSDGDLIISSVPGNTVVSIILPEGRDAHV